MVGERRAAHLHVAGGIDADPRRGPTGDRQTELITALEQCARGGQGAVESLRLWQDGRIPAMLRRMLGDPARANHTFDRFVADLAGTSGAEHGWSAANAEDWLFRSRWRSPGCTRWNRWSVRWKRRSRRP